MCSKTTGDASVFLKQTYMQGKEKNMTELEAINQRHSVRQFEKKPIDPAIVKQLMQKMDEVNRESGLHIQLFTDEPGAFLGNETHYGQFSRCCDYFAVVGPKGKDETVGYYGQKLVLYAQTLGINSCWVALTYKKGNVKVDAAAGEKLYIVIALGYGKTEGIQHKNKDIGKLSDLTFDSPEWYRKGVHAALLAPTAMNQQKFRITRDGNKVSIKAGMGFYTKMDLGIVKYNFEVGAGKENFSFC